MKLNLVILFLATLFATSLVQAQGWERQYAPGGFIDFTQTPDGGFLLAGDYDVWSDADKASITKVDADGDVEWVQRYAVGDSLESYAGLLIVDQHIVAVGTYMRYPGSPERQLPFLHLLDPQGNLLKEVKLDPTPTIQKNYYTSDAVATAQGNIWMCTDAYPGLGTLHAFSSNLDPLWSVNLVTRIVQMIALPDGTVLLSGMKGGAMYLSKMDATGNLLWEKSYENGVAKMTLTQDGNLVLAANNYLIKVTTDGTIIWSKPGISATQSSSWLTEDHQGNLLVMGTYSVNTTSVFSLGKFDVSGNLIWKKTPHQSLQGSQSNAKPLVTSDGGYALAGKRNGKSMLIRSDSDFEVYRSWIVGNMYHDVDDDCTKDAGEKHLKHFYVSVTDANGTTWAENIVDGRYAMQVPTGNYEVAISKRVGDPESWEPCQAQNATITATTDTAHIADIGVKSLIDCPRPHIKAGIQKIRHCADNQYVITCENYGTEKITDSRIEVELPEFLTYISCDWPLVSQNGQKFTFDGGDLDIDESTQATLSFSCACDVALGDIACTTFRVTPDTCYPTLTNWDYSILKTDGTFDPSTVTFSLENIGTGNMAAPLNYHIRSGCIGILNEGTFQLNVGETKVITIPNNTIAYSFTAEQPGNQVYVPGNRADLWKCQNNPIQEVWWNSQTGSPFYAIDCEEVKNSFDPNDIQVAPRGDGDSHFILADEPSLTYKIRFQNTGNDTAFVVSIRDTLPDALSVLTVVPGPSSHAYTFDIQNQAIKFLFKDINLPDSTTNLEGSQGFVTFTVKMKPNLSAGTRIENRAAIFFDFNPPIITNTVFNVIHEPVSVSVEIPASVQATVKVVPNPATDFAVFQFETTAKGQFYLINSAGQQVVSSKVEGLNFKLDCQGLPPGVYFFNMHLEGQRPINGRLVTVK